MKRITLFLFLLLLAPFTAQGSLIDMGETIHDDINDRYWIQDSAGFVGLTYSEQISAILSLTTDGKNWRMANGGEMELLRDTYSWEEIAGAFTPTHENEWKGRYDQLQAPGRHYEWIILNMLTYWTGGSVGVKDWEVFPGAFAISYELPPPSPSAAPVPAPIILLATGLVGMAGFRRKLR